MVITVNDLKLVESENMSNAPEGGGSFTNNVIIDGASNNLFDDVTQQDRVYGKVNDRKVFAAVRTQNTDKLMSAMAYVSKLPTDENINVNLFKSEIWHDERANRSIKTKTYKVPNEILLRLDNASLNNQFNSEYQLKEGKKLSCFVSGTVTAQTRQIEIIGIDGTVKDLEDINNTSSMYGINGIKNIFKNKFLLTDGVNSEVVIVEDVNVTHYSQAPYVSTDINGIRSIHYVGNVETSPPGYFYRATLTFPYLLQNSYQGVDADDSASWIAETTNLLTFKDKEIGKFYGARKISYPIASTQSTNILISNNTNKVIPIINDSLINPALDSETLGINTNEFTPDGIYSAFDQGDIGIILNDKETTDTYTNGQTVTLTRQNLAKVTVRDSAGNPIDASRFSVNLTAGTVQFIDVSGLSQPLKITDRIEDMFLIRLVHDEGIIVTVKPLTHSYPVEGTIVSNCCLFGTLYASVSKPFDQQTWTNVWSDVVIGSTVTAQYDFVNYPIVVNNLNAVTDRWAIIFTSSTVFNLVSEQFGQVITGHNISDNLEPINPATGQPYFTLPTLGLGGGWSAGNVIRFNTYAAAAPFWVLQSISQGKATDPDFNFAIEIRGDIDAA